MLLEKELFNLKNCKLNLLKFYQGKDLQKGNIIQTAVFKKVKLIFRHCWNSFSVKIDFF